jgi:hypothetical protein
MFKLNYKSRPMKNLANCWKDVSSLPSNQSNPFTSNQQAILLHGEVASTIKRQVPLRVVI